MTTTAFPTLPSTWAPSSQCIATDAFWYVVERTYLPSGTQDVGGIIFSLMYGAPTPTVLGTITGIPPSGTCIPPSFQSDVPYISDSDICPTGYSFACETATKYSGQVVSVVTCCQRLVLCDPLPNNSPIVFAQATVTNQGSARRYIGWLIYLY